MTIETHESARSADWEPFYGLRVPIPEPGSGHPAATVAFRALLRSSIRDADYQFRIDDDGSLLFRPREPGTEVETTIPGPGRTHAALLIAYQQLGTNPPPPEYRPFAESRASRQFPDAIAGQVRSAVAPLVEGASSLAGEGPLNDPGPAARFQTRLAHFQFQFAELHRWWDDLSAGDEAGSALEAWHQSLPKAQRLRSVAEVLIPLAGDAELIANGVPVGITVSRDGSHALLTIRAPRRPTVLVPVSGVDPVATGKQVPELSGVLVQLRRSGLVVTTEDTAGPANLECSPFPGDGMQVIRR